MKPSYFKAKLYEQDSHRILSSCRLLFQVHCWTSVVNTETNYRHYHCHLEPHFQKFSRSFISATVEHLLKQFTVGWCENRKQCILELEFFVSLFLGDRLQIGSPYAIGPLSCPVCMSVLSVTFVYCGQAVGRSRWNMACRWALALATLC